MKNLIVSVLVSLSAVAAQASTVTCTTNTTNDPRSGSTDVSVLTENGQLVAKMIHRGGMAHFITAPQVIPVEAKRTGPEVVTYLNTDLAFQLQIVYQPMGGQIHGTLSTLISGKEVSWPVVCKTSAN